MYACVCASECRTKPLHAGTIEGQFLTVFVTSHVTLFVVVTSKPGLQVNVATLPSLLESVNVIKPFCGFVGGDPHCLREQVPSYSFESESQLIVPKNPALQLHKSPSCLLEFSMLQAVAEEMCKCTY